MTKVESDARVNDFGLVGRLGQAYQYGAKIYGRGHYGDEEIYSPASENGVKINGDYFFGDMDNLWGIYQRRHHNGKVTYARLKFYNPTNPRTAPQTTQRNKFVAGMAAWSILTNKQKSSYNERAKAKHLHGVNLYLREYLNSN